jgi:hypothetical protein
MFTFRAVRPMRRLLVVVALAALGACAEQRPTEPTKPGASGSLDGLFSSGPKLVQCATDETTSAVGSITELGGTLSIGGTSVVFPAGAVLGATNVTLTIPASRYVEIEIKADDQEHFVFEQPIVVTIDYSRCQRSDVLVKPLSVWYIDAQTKDLLEQMTVGIDNKLTQSITFSTPHLSGYAIAF